MNQSIFTDQQPATVNGDVMALYAFTNNTNQDMFLDEIALQFTNFGDTNLWAIEDFVVTHGNVVIATHNNNLAHHGQQYVDVDVTIQPGQTEYINIYAQVDGSYFDRS